MSEKWKKINYEIFTYLHNQKNSIPIEISFNRDPNQNFDQRSYYLNYFSYNINLY